MANRLFLRRYDTKVIAEQFAGGTGLTSTSFDVQTGSRLTLSLYVLEIDSGVTVTAQIKNTFSDQVPAEVVATIVATAVGPRRQVLIDFHNRFEVEVNVTGGNAKWALGGTVHENALASQVKIDQADITVGLSHLLDEDGEYDSVRTGDGRYEMLVRPDKSINTQKMNQLIVNPHDDIGGAGTGMQYNAAGDLVTAPFYLAGVLVGQLNFTYHPDGNLKRVYVTSGAPLNG